MDTGRQSRVLRKSPTVDGDSSLLGDHLLRIENFLEKKYVKLQTGTIRYLEGGTDKKTRLILLHGLGGSADRWTRAMPFLCEKYHVIAPDMPGFGHSDKPPVDYNPEFFVRFVFDMLDSLGIEKINIVGSSLGGQIAAECAATQDPRIDSIALVSPSGTLKEVTPALGAYFASALYPIHHVVRDAYQMMLNPLQNRLVDSETVERFIETISQPDSLLAFMSTIHCFRSSPSITERLSKVAVPTLLIWGRHDMIIPITCAGDFVALIKDCRFEIMERCGHLPHVEEPEMFSDTVSDFLARLVKSNAAQVHVDSIETLHSKH